MEEDYDFNYDEQKNWAAFKETMQKKSMDLMGEIDFLFPVNIQTHEILKPLFLEFLNMDTIHYRLILPREIEGVDALITQWDYFGERLMGEDM